MYSSTEEKKGGTLVTDKQLILIVFVKNCIVMICWTILAICFSKWWIALFAVLFMNGFKPSTVNSCYCDQCGVFLPFVGTSEELRKAEYEAGWARYKINDTYKDYCPKCKDNVCEKS